MQTAATVSQTTNVTIVVVRCELRGHRDHHQGHFIYMRTIYKDTHTYTHMPSGKLTFALILIMICG